jgi:hypothetical protein
VDFCARRQAESNALWVPRSAIYGVAACLALLNLAIEQIPQIVKRREFKAWKTRFIDSVLLPKTLAKTRN